MTTAQQRKFYHPRFRRAAAAHGWRESLRGADLAATRKFSWGAPTVNALYAKVWFIGLGLAELEEREFVLADLRHACNLVATSRKRHSKELNNREVNRVVALFDLLADPDDLAAMNAWLHPDLAARAGVLAQLHQLAPWAYVAEVARGKFHTPEWETLGDRELQQLLFTIKDRARSRGRAVPSSPTPQIQ